eukprot:Awhi_evm1s14189
MKALSTPFLINSCKQRPFSSLQTISHFSATTTIDTSANITKRITALPSPFFTKNGYQTIKNTITKNGYEETSINAPLIESLHYQGMNLYNGSMSNSNLFEKAKYLFKKNFIDAAIKSPKHRHFIQTPLTNEINQVLKKLATVAHTIGGMSTKAKLVELNFTMSFPESETQSIHTDIFPLTEDSQKLCTIWLALQDVNDKM